MTSFVGKEEGATDGWWLVTDEFRHPCGLTFFSEVNLLFILSLETEP